MMMAMAQQWLPDSFPWNTKLVQDKTSPDLVVMGGD